MDADTVRLYTNVKCISTRKSKPNQIKIEETYILDRASIWIDIDGDAYGVIYSPDMERIGQLKLNHFMSI